MKTSAWMCGVLMAGLAIGGCASSRETKVALSDVPPAVRATIESAAQGATISEIEKETKGGKTVYEAEFVRDSRKYEVEVAEDGKLIKTGLDD